VLQQAEVEEPPLQVLLQQAEVEEPLPQVLLQQAEVEVELLLLVAVEQKLWVNNVTTMSVPFA